MNRRRVLTHISCCIGTQVMGLGACLALPPVQVPAPVRSHIGAARLLGSGSFRWFGLRIYDARLFVPATAAASAAEAAAGVPNLPLALELTYARSLDGLAIAERSDDEMAAIEPAMRNRWREPMRSLFPDVKADDRLTGIWRPDGPTHFYLNDRAIGRVNEPGFGPAFFGIWLHPKTSAPALREALLGSRSS